MTDVGFNATEKSPTKVPLPILHVEVGGSWGGSLRILELQLAHYSGDQFIHDVLLYYPTPGLQRIRALARKVWSLHDSAPERKTTLTGWRAAVKRVLGETPASCEWLRVMESCWTVFRIASVLRRSQYTLVHVNNTFCYQPATLIAAWLTRLPIVSHTRNPTADTLLNRSLIRMTDYIATANQHSTVQLRSWGTRVPVETCYEPAECPQPEPTLAEDFRKSLLGDGKVLVGSIGRLDKQKGFAHFIRAARLVVDNCPSVRFAIAGTGPEEAALRDLIDKLGLTERFALCGFRPDFYNFMSALDLFVCSSLWEGSPLSLVEAILLGKPVVSTDVGIASELIPSNDQQIVRPGDFEGLAAAINAALQEESIAKRRIEEIRNRASCLTDPTSTTRELEDIFSRFGLFAVDARGR